MAHASEAVTAASLSRRTFRKGCAARTRRARTASTHHLLREAQERKSPATIQYVIDPLDPANAQAVEAIARDLETILRQPGDRDDKPCVYVGLTGLTPEQRFERHKAGIQPSRIVKRYGIRLRPKYYEKLNPMSYEDAAAMEIELANRLKSRGFGVWQK